MKNLDPIFEPESIAVIGASNQEGSVGYGLFNNLKDYQGDLYAVNPKRDRYKITRPMIPCKILREI